MSKTYLYPERLKHVCLINVDPNSRGLFHQHKQRPPNQNTVISRGQNTCIFLDMFFLEENIWFLSGPNNDVFNPPKMRMQMANKPMKQQLPLKTTKRTSSVFSGTLPYST